MPSTLDFIKNRQIVQKQLYQKTFKGFAPLSPTFVCTDMAVYLGLSILMYEMCVYTKKKYIDMYI